MSGQLAFAAERAARKLLARAGGSAMALVERDRSERVVTTGYGVKMRANWRDRTFQYAWAASYGRTLSDLLSHRRESFVFLDIGANQGLFSLIAARNPACAKVIALEPVAATFALLEANIAANAASERVRPIRAALSDRTGESAIRIRPGHSGAATLRIDHDFADRTEMIALVRPDALAPHIPDRVPIIAKVDVEGHEEVIIADLISARFAPRIEEIFYEIDEQWTDPARVRALLKRTGFGSFHKCGTGRHYDMLAVRTGATGCIG